MPAQERRRGDDEAGPAVARDQAAGRCEGHPVAGLVSGWARLAPQHPELMAEHQNLKVPGSIGSATSAAADEETRYDASDEGEQVQHRSIVPGR